MRISSISATGSMTTPLPITQVVPVVEDPARDEVEDELLILPRDRVAGIRAALVAGDDVHFGSEKVDDLPLSFVAPLGADDDSYGHDSERIEQAEHAGPKRRALRRQGGETSRHSEGGRDRPAAFGECAVEA